MQLLLSKRLHCPEFQEAVLLITALDVLWKVGILESPKKEKGIHRKKWRTKGNNKDAKSSLQVAVYVLLICLFIAVDIQ